MEKKVLIDRNLVNEIKNGNVLAFEILVKRYQRPFYSFVFKITGNDLIVEDILQETFLKIYKNIDKFDIKRKFSTWAFEIAKNTAISHLRKEKSKVSLKNIDISIDETHYENAIKQENKRVIGKILNKMDSKYKSAVKLFYFDELSYKEISDKLNLPINTVRTRISRGKKIVSDVLRSMNYE
ncbi:MAG TPA: RNA polymerase sigma factor [Candidatus Saccharimonadales bacterium]|nr:RNA polymerase sigma factor [Candidatus Saccharimonadales bacterium]